MTIEAMKQALAALQYIHTETSVDEDELIHSTITALRAAIELAQKPALVVPNEVAAELTTTDIAWLSTHLLTRLWIELGQMRWAGADDGWDRAVEAVRNRINDECQAVLDWKKRADQSNEKAIELLQKMQRMGAEK